MKKVIIKSLVCFVLIIVTINVNAQNFSDGAKLTAEFPSTNPAENVSKLNDKNLSTKFCIRNISTMWFQYELTSAAIVTKYAISSANDMPERDPKGWILQASNDGFKWKDLDVKKDEKFTGRRETKTYDVINDVTYKFYRIRITESNGASFLQLSEWHLIK
ncbi:MAG: discoidin domain-containing protein [Bacteroidales bacterium]|nr:discoidin domain-containing protein [Bacteroidales bacterium]